MPKQQPSRRSNGAGSVYWAEDRQRWIAAVTATDRYGRTRRRKATAKTIDEAYRRLADLQRVTPELPASPTLSQFLTYWIDDVLPLQGLAPATVRSYADRCHLYIDPIIGAITLAELTPADIRHMFSTMTRQGYSPGTINGVRRILRLALGVARADRLVDRNVADRDHIRMSTPRTRRDTLTPAQAVAVLDAAHRAGQAPLVTVMVMLGLRRQEALGLRWRDIDLDGPRPMLSIAGVISSNGRGGQYWRPGGKTGAATRTLDLPTTVADVLAAHREAQRLEAAVVGPDWAADAQWPDFVFTNATGDARNLSKTTHLVTRITADAGVGHWTPHGLRHTAASLLIAAKVPLELISESLGHSSIAITKDVYGHLLPPARAEVAAAMQAVIFGPAE